MTAEEKRLWASIAELEAKHPERDTPDQWMPWHTNDDALSMEHWRLVHARLDLKWERPASEERLRALEHAREARKRLRKPAVEAPKPLYETTVEPRIGV